MKILILISILLLTSCSTMRIKRMYNREIRHQNKEYSNNVSNLISNTESSDTSYIRYAIENLKLDHDYIIKDLDYRKSQVKYLSKEEKKTILYGKVIKLAKIDTDGDGVPDFTDVDPDMFVEEMLLEYYVYPQHATEVYTEADRKIKKSKLDVVDKTTKKVDKSSKGTIAYSVPNEMQVGKQYVIKLRITKERGKEVNRTLVLGDRDIPINDINIDSKVTIENIRVEKTMTAQLISADDVFKVTPQNTEKQVVEDGEYTEWGWLVTPLKSGDSYLKLIIKIRIDADGETTYKDIVVFDKNIKIKSNINHGIKNWLSEYWQWLMTTIIIPLVVFFYRNKKKKDAQPEE